MKLHLHANNRKSANALYSLPSFFSSLTLHFYYFLDKVKILLSVKKQNLNINLNIAVAGSAGNLSSSIAVGSVAIFQVKYHEQSYQ